MVIKGYDIYFNWVFSLLLFNVLFMGGAGLFCRVTFYRCPWKAQMTSWKKGGGKV